MTATKAVFLTLTQMLISLYVEQHSHIINKDIRLGTSSGYCFLCGYYVTCQHVYNYFSNEESHMLFISPKVCKLWLKVRLVSTGTLPSPKETIKGNIKTVTEYKIDEEDGKKYKVIFDRLKCHEQMQHIYGFMYTIY